MRWYNGYIKLRLVRMVCELIGRYIRQLPLSGRDILSIRYVYTGGCRWEYCKRSSANV